MCIRDSPGTESGKPFYWALGMVALLAVMFIGWRLMAGGVAVSYTHLRAHETVLDLVCRLLLEKHKLVHTHSPCYYTSRYVYITVTLLLSVES